MLQTRKKDPGEKFPWKILFKNKIGIWHNLSNKKLNFLRHKIASVKETNLFMKSLRKLDYPAKSSIFKNKLKFKKIVNKSFSKKI